MPRIEVTLFKEDDEIVPLVAWLDGLPNKASARCVAALCRLAQLGHELRRPEADYLRDEIYELRVGLQGINFRMLYFFHGREAVVLSHGLVKQQAAVPPREIERAIDRKRSYQTDPKRYALEAP